MKFELSEDQALLRSSTHDFLAGEWPMEKVRAVLENEAAGYTEEGWSRLAEMGYLGLTLPAAQGGQGLGAVELAIVCEEVGRFCMPGPYLDAVLAAETLAAAGQEALLAELIAGEKLVTLARDDSAYAGAPTHLPHMAGGKLRDTKFYVPFAAMADALLVTAADGVFLTEKPFAVTPLESFDLSARFGKVVFDHNARRIAGPEILTRVDLLGSVGAAAMQLGIMSRCLELTLEYSKTRKTFGKPIGAFQALQHRLSEMLLRTESTRSAVYRAAWCIDTNDASTAMTCAAAKAYAGDASRLVCGEAIQLHGGIGFTWELDLHFFFKRGKTLEMHYGSTETQLERVLAAVGV
jgi:alkylation response protein AidB-like acyl-CoA dehydrogenase